MGKEERAEGILRSFTWAIGGMEAVPKDDRISEFLETLDSRERLRLMRRLARSRDPGHQPGVPSPSRSWSDAAEFVEDAFAWFDSLPVSKLPPRQKDFAAYCAKNPKTVNRWLNRKAGYKDWDDLVAAWMRQHVHDDGSRFATTGKRAPASYTAKQDAGPKLPMPGDQK